MHVAEQAASKAADPPLIPDMTAWTQEDPGTSPFPNWQRCPGGSGGFLHAGASAEAVRSVEGTQGMMLRWRCLLRFGRQSYLQSWLLGVHKLFLEKP